MNRVKLQYKNSDAFWTYHHPLFFLGRANLEAILASGEGKSSPSSAPSPLHHPSMTSPLMCE